MSSQEETNRREWENEENWGGPSWANIYFSKRDTRAIVPKRVPWMGWTFNLGSSAGVVWFFGLLLLAVLLPVVLIVWQALCACWKG
jgi:uncharacterized membrane protein